MDVLETFPLAAASVTTAVPVFWAVRDQKSKRITRAGIVFLVASFVAAGGGAWQLQQAHRAAEDAANQNRALVTKIEREATRLKQNDFGLRVISFAPELRELEPMPSPIHATATVGDLELSFELSYIPSPWRIRAGRGGGGRTGYRWVSTNMTVFGLQQASHLDELYGSVAKIRVRAEDLQLFQSESWEHHVDLVIGGELFTSGSEPFVVPIQHQS